MTAHEAGELVARNLRGWSAAETACAWARLFPGWYWGTLTPTEDGGLLWAEGTEPEAE